MDEQKISDAYEKAPEGVKNYIDGKQIDDTVIHIASSLGFPISSYSPIKNACALVLLGVVESSDLTGSLEEALQIDRPSAEALTKKIDDSVFNTVRELLNTKIVTNDKEVKEIKLSDAGQRGSLRSVILEKNDTVKQNKPTNTSIMGSRSMLMDQLALIGKIPNDESVLDRLNKIKEQLRKGEEAKKLLDIEIQERIDQERVNHYSKEIIPAARRVYDIDPYREHIEELDKTL